MNVFKIYKFAWNWKYGNSINQEIFEFEKIIEWIALGIEVNDFEFVFLENVSIEKIITNFNQSQLKLLIKSNEVVLMKIL